MPSEDKNENRKEYILKRGYSHHGINKDGVRTQYTGGVKDQDRVLLTEQQFQSFGDKFESVEELKLRQSLEREAGEANAKLAEIGAKLAEQGMSLDDLLAGAQLTNKKPDPTPSVGTSEPTPENVTPNPIGSTADPVHAPTATPAGKMVNPPADPVNPTPGSEEFKVTGSSTSNSTPPNTKPEVKPAGSKN